MSNARGTLTDEIAEMLGFYKRVAELSHGAVERATVRRMQHRRAAPTVRSDTFRVVQKNVQKA